MFSNNHINEVVGMHFDFDDEEVLGHYITLLKSISLKLNKDTVQFFYDKGSFPLYSEAIRLINHHDGMVRAAVRTLTLKVYHIRDPAVQSFVISQPASHYFSRLATYVADQCQVSVVWSHTFASQRFSPGCGPNMPDIVSSPKLFLLMCLSASWHVARHRQTTPTPALVGSSSFPFRFWIIC